MSGAKFLISAWSKPERRYTFYTRIVMIKSCSQRAGRALVTVEVRDVAAVLGSVVAVISIGMNVYLAYLLRRERPHVARVGEVREAVQKMINTLRGRVMSGPQKEWEFAFEGLK